ncbi:MAG: sodium:solute symporter, partial [Weeksellaceae bacterium]|nr:sodium:solute symporter [Weeksellaceae bacterium]
MQAIDWLILVGSLLFIVVYGTWKTRHQRSIKDFLKGEDANWFAVGLSVMATQASAITFLSTP